MTNLAPPGAGLPLPELFIARIKFRLTCWKTSREQSIADFHNLQAGILGACERLTSEQAATQTLIKRLRGLEDSSRNWSVYMTVEHLCIVNDSVANTCTALSMGSKPNRAVSTANVKPNSGTGPEIMKAFEESCAGFMETISSIEDLKTVLKFNHPWFGPLNAAQWLTLVPFHMRLHLAQINRISAALCCLSVRQV